MQEGLTELDAREWIERSNEWWPHGQPRFAIADPGDDRVLGENTPSNRLAERLGFSREGVLRSYEPFKGHRPDLASWSLLPHDPRPWHR